MTSHLHTMSYLRLTLVGNRRNRAIPRFREMIGTGRIRTAATRIALRITMTVTRAGVKQRKQTRIGLNRKGISVKKGVR